MTKTYKYGFLTLAKESIEIVLKDFWKILRFFIYIVIIFIFVSLCISTFFSYLIDLIPDNFTLIQKAFSGIAVFLPLIISLLFLFAFIFGSITKFWQTILVKDHQDKGYEGIFGPFKYAFHNLNKLFYTYSVFYLSLFLYISPLLIILVTLFLKTGNYTLYKEIQNLQTYSDTELVSFFSRFMGYSYYFIIVIIVAIIYFTLRWLFIFQVSNYSKIYGFKALNKSTELTRGAIVYLFKLGFYVTLISLIFNFLNTFGNSGAIGSVASSILSGFTFVLSLLVEVTVSCGINLLYIKHFSEKN